MQILLRNLYGFLVATLLSSWLIANTVDKSDALLKQASVDIKHHTDTNAVVESLYSQMRPRVLVHDSSLDKAIIDKKTKAYIQNRYTPALIANYIHLYDKMRHAHKDFTPCNNPQPFDANTSLQQTLCKVQRGNTLIVLYLTRIPPNAWKISAEYHFSKQKNTLTLKAIQLSLPPEAKVRIGGL
jgi:hypothetical protein